MQLVNILSSSVGKTFKGIIATVGNYLGSLAKSDVINDSTEVFQQPGLASRPKDADSSGSVEAITHRFGNREVCIATRDLRANKVIGTLEPGDTCLHSIVDKEAFSMIAMKADDGSITIYAPGDIDGNGVPKKAQAIVLQPEKEAITICNVDGSSINMGTSGITITSASGTNIVAVSNSGITMAGNISLIGNIAIQGNCALMVPPICNGSVMTVP